MTTAPAEPAAPPRAVDLRIVAARPCEPCYDDELPPGAPSSAVVDGSLALALPVGRQHPAEHRLRLVAAPAAVGSGAATGCPPKPWLARLVQAMAEALAGERPLHQLAGYLSPAVYAGLERSITRRNRRPAARPVTMPTVRSLRVCEPKPGTAEVAAVVSKGERMGAMALRLEATDGRWRCTALQVG